jgi:hypothetical protein
MEKQDWLKPVSMTSQGCLALVTFDYGFVLIQQKPTYK